MNIPFNYIFDAAKEIYPNAEISIFNDEIVWHNPSHPPVSNEVLLEKAKELTLKFEYKELRKEKYPNILDQLDMLWHDINQGKLNKDSSFYRAIKTIKDEFPKS